MVRPVFSGPHTHISPTWYEAENVVPTWNCVAVHACGTCRRVLDPDALAGILAVTVSTYERSLPNPWSVNIRSDFIRHLAKAVVGIRIEVDRLEGKYKLNRNLPQERREKVVRALAGSDDLAAREVARLMSEMLGGNGR